MRSPIIAFSLMAAAAVSPSLVSAMPLPPFDVSSPSIPSTPASGLPADLPSPGNPGQQTQTDNPGSTGRAKQDSKNENEPHNVNEHHRRANDGQTAGGNAYTGPSNDVYGGNVINESGSETNTQSNTLASSE